VDFLLLKFSFHVAWEFCFVIMFRRMIELFFEVGPGKPRIHVPIQANSCSHPGIHISHSHTPFRCSFIYL